MNPLNGALSTHPGRPKAPGSVCRGGGAWANNLPPEAGPVSPFDTWNRITTRSRQGGRDSGPLTWSALQGLAGLGLAAWCETRLKWRTWAWDPGRHRRGHRGSWHQDPASDQSKLKPWEALDEKANMAAQRTAFKHHQG